MAVCASENTSHPAGKSLKHGSRRHKQNTFTGKRETPSKTPVTNMGVSWAEPQQTDKVRRGFPTHTDWVRKLPGKETPTPQLSKQNPSESKLLPRGHGQRTYLLRDLVSKDCVWHQHRDSVVEVIRICERKKRGFLGDEAASST